LQKDREAEVISAKRVKITKTGKRINKKPTSEMEDAFKPQFQEKRKQKALGLELPLDNNFSNNFTFERGFHSTPPIFNSSFNV